MRVQSATTIKWWCVRATQKTVATHPLLSTNYAYSIFPPFLTQISLKDGNVIYKWPLTTEQRLIANVNCSLFNSFLLAFAIQVIGWNFFLIFIVRKLFTVTWCFPFAVVISVGLLFDVGINSFWKEESENYFSCTKNILYLHLGDLLKHLVPLIDRQNWTKL